MPYVELTSRVDPDGVLRICVPLGPGEANRDVKVVVEPAQERTEPPTRDQEGWRQFVSSMAGCIADPSFERPDQGDYERRSDLFP